MFAQTSAKRKRKQLTLCMDHCNKIKAPDSSKGSNQQKRKKQAMLIQR